MAAGTQNAYTNRASEYTSLLGSMDAVHAADRHLVETWADQVDGAILDAGCGPGHWTAHLARRGHNVKGIDLVPAFIEHARTEYPDVAFDTGSIDSLDAPTGSLGGVLTWYSLIHHDPTSIHVPLQQLARVLQPNGSLLLGFFVGPSVEAFDHAVTTAYYWPISVLTSELEAAGFEVEETHARTGAGYRPHGAVMATRKAVARRDRG